MPLLLSLLLMLVVLLLLLLLMHDDFFLSYFDMHETETYNERGKKKQKEKNIWKRTKKNKTKKNKLYIIKKYRKHLKTTPFNRFDQKMKRKRKNKKQNIMQQEHIVRLFPFDAFTCIPSFICFSIFAFIWYSMCLVIISHQLNCKIKKALISFEVHAQYHENRILCNESKNNERTAK